MRHLFIADLGLITMDYYDYDYDFILQKKFDYDYDYDYRKCCNQLQSITIVIVISPKSELTTYEIRTKLTSRSTTIILVYYAEPILLCFGIFVNY